MCIKHEPKLTRVFVRGRPWPPPALITKRPQLLAPVAEAVPHGFR
jgi:hypothetical protein